MSAIALAQAAFERHGLRATLKNMMFERAPLNQQDQVSLIQRAGITSQFVQGVDPVRGAFIQPGTFGGDMIVLIGTTLYRAASAGPVVLGVIPGAGRVSMAGSGAAVLIATGDALYSTNGTTVAAVSFPDAAGVAWVVYLNGYFIALRTGSQRYYFSAVGGITFDALDFLAAENSADNLLAAAVVGDELWLFGQGSIEIHTPTGDPDAPFLRINGRLFGIGCASADTVTVLDGRIGWVGANRVAYLSGPQPEPISDEGLNEKIAKADPATLKGWTYSLGGHEHFVLNVGAETQAFDTSTKFWHQMQSYGRTSFRGHCSPFGLNPNAAPLVGDDTTGTVWRFDPTLNTDGGQPLVREFSGLVTADGRARCDKVHLICRVGEADAAYPDEDPQVELRVSDDRGHNWSGWRRASLGRQGRFNHRPLWKQLGAMEPPGRVFHWRCSSNVPFSVERAKLNEWRA